jgi:hypothetical protein
MPQSIRDEVIKSTHTEPVGSANTSNNRQQANVLAESLTEEYDISGSYQITLQMIEKYSAIKLCYHNGQRAIQPA